ncbi:MAG: endonuclease III [Firmicutes bacterium]|nr:endonuclease III [Bacillota bacterium]
MDYLDEIFGYFESLFGKEPKTELTYSSDLELLVAVMLSAQCTDKRVNIVTPILFKHFPTLESLANADLPTLTRLISSVNFFNNKAKHIKGMAVKVVNEFGGIIPSEIEELIRLPGVGRKTASVFVAEYHHKPAIAVDTHVARVAQRLGWTTSKNPVQIERDLRDIWPEVDWARWHLYMVLFGRYHCTARTKSCIWCPSSKTIVLD